MKFFLGIDDPHQAGDVPRAFVSVHRLARRARPVFPVNDWIMDSGAFTTIAKHGGYPNPVSDYAREIRRFTGCGNLLAVVSQDYMCEAVMLERTGLTIAEHQRLTIERYDALLAEDVGVYVMPVLQGYAPESYVEHIRQYGARLAPGAWVGVGSVCKRNGNPAKVEGVLLAIKRARPDLLLHGFGVKIIALQSQLVRDLLHTADSMAWSFAARYEGRDNHDIREAQRYGARVDAMPVQSVMDELL